MTDKQTPEALRQLVTDTRAKIHAQFGTQSHARHRASGKLVYIVQPYLHESTLVPHVLYHEIDDSIPWGRPLDEFLERFEPGVKHD